MGEVSWPSTGYNSGDLTDTENELLSIDGYTHDGLIGLPTDQPLVFADSSGRQVKWRASRSAVVRGQRWSSDGSGVTSSIAANSSGQTRVDLATLRLDRGAIGGPVVRTHIITGTPGSGAPSPVQNDPGTGSDVWDYPCATVAVANGTSNLAPGTVTPTAYYLGEPVYLCTSATRPPHRFGRRIKESDTGKSYESNGSSWVLQFEDTNWNTVSMGSGWAGTVNLVRRLNGVTFVQLQLTRSGAVVAAGTDSPIATLPVGFRPDQQHVVNGSIGGTPVRVRIDTTGLMTLTDHPSIPNGGFVSLGTVSFPAA